MVKPATFAMIDGAGWNWVHCFLCGSMSHKPIFEHKTELFGTQVRAALCRCECGMLLTNPQPGPGALRSLYATDEYYTHTGCVSRFARIVEYLRLSQLYGVVGSVRLLAEQRFGVRRYALRLAPRHFRLSRGLQFMDFGCGGGKLLKLAQRMGLRAVGVDSDLKALSVARSRGVVVYNSLEDLDRDEAIKWRERPARFDRILLSHVLEHLQCPQQTLEALRARLDPGGSMLISVPNADSEQAKVYGPFWIGYDMPRHLWHFTQETLNRLLQSARLSVCHQQTLELDAFARASEMSMHEQGVPAPHYRPRPLSVMEREGGGTELVTVVRAA